MPPVNQRSKLLGFPKSHAVVIGINNYPGINANLVSAVPDATRLAKVLKEKQGFDHVELLTNPKKADILDLLARIKDDTKAPVIKPQDSLVFYYAGHGKAGEFDQGPAGYLLPSDAKPQSAALNNDSLIKMEEVFDTLSTLNCHHTLLIFDCCFAGKFRYVGQKSRDTETPFFMPMYEERFERYKRKKAWQVLVSAGPDQTAADWMGDRASDGQTVHSPFAKALFDSLEGKAEVKPKGKNLGDGVLTVQELFLYLWNMVENKTKEDSKFPIQYPDLFPMGTHQGGQFIFFDPNNKLNFANRIERNPYKGLHPYEEADQDLFFGRQSVIADLYKKVLQTPILVVSAPSGLGKSSVVRAGLWPLLKEKEGFEACFVIRPGNEPYGQLKALQGLDPSKKQLLIVDQYEELFTETVDLEERAMFEKNMKKLLASAQNGQLKIALTIRSDFDWQLSGSVFGKEFWDPELFYQFLHRLPPLSLDELREVVVNPAWVEAFDFESDDLVDTILQEVSYAPGALPLLSFTMGELYNLTDKDKRIFTRNNYQKKLGGVNGALSKRADEVFQSLDVAHQDMMRMLLLRMVRLNEGSFSRRRVFVSTDPKDKEKGLSHELDYPQDTQDHLLKNVVNALGDSLLVRGKDGLGRSYLEPVHDSLINYWPTCLQWIQDFGKENLLLQRQLWQAVQDFYTSGEYKQAVMAQTDSSALWDQNPKLEQVLQSILDPTDTWLCHVPGVEIYPLFFLLWENDPAEEQLSPLLAWKSRFKDAQTAQEIFAKVKTGMKNWLNHNELEFIRRSYDRRESQIENLKRQRDEARSSALAARSLLQAETDPTLSLNLARFAYGLAPGEESAQALCEALSRPEAHFYQKKLRHNPSSVIIDGPIPIPEPVNCVDISPDEKYLVTSGHLGSLKIWNLEDGKELHRHQEPEDPNGSTYFSFVRFLPGDKKVLAMMGYSGKSFVWDPEKKNVRAFPKSPERIANMLHTQEKDQVFILLENGEYWNWDLDKNKLSQVSENPGFWTPEKKLSSGETQILSPDGNKICTFSDKFIRVNGRQDGSELFHYKEADPDNKYIHDVAFSPNGSHLVSAHNDSYVRFWQITKRKIRSVTEPDESIHYAFLTPAGIAFFISHLGNGVAFGRDLNGNPVCTLTPKQHHSFEIIDCQDPAKSVISATTYNNGLAADISKWNVSGELEKSVSNPHKSRMRFLKLKPDGQLFLSCGGFNSSIKDFDRDIFIWDLQLNQTQTLSARKGITAISISPDGNTIAAIGGNRHLHLWNWQGASLLFYDFGEYFSVSQIALSPDNKWLAASCNDGKIRMLNLESQMQEAPFRGGASGMQFSADGKYLFGTGGGIQAWSKEGRLLMSLREGTRLSDLQLSPDEQFFRVISGAFSGGSCEVQIWRNPFWELEQGLIDGLDELERKQFGIKN